MKENILDQTRDSKYKDHMRDNFERHSFSKGNMVLVMQKKGNKLKLTPSFNQTPLRITNIKGSMITASTESI